MSLSRPHSAQRLERGEFVRLCYQLGQRKATGVLTLELDQGKSERFILRRRQVFAPDSDALGRETRRCLEILAVAGCSAEAILRVVAQGEKEIARKPCRGQQHEPNRLRMRIRFSDF